MTSQNNKKGILVIEILIVVAIIGITSVSVLGLVTLSLKVATLMKGTIQAKDIAQETIEQVRNFRDGTEWDVDGLENYSGTYHLEKSGDPPKWVLISGGETINGFFRKVIFDDVYRDSITDDIEIGGDYLDPNTKKITAMVSWQERGRTHQIEIVTYLTNWRQ